jgi:inosine/guanosine/xanthosine phosphorylase family protein
LLLGRIGRRTLWIVQGRAHLYEGHEPETATRYVRLLHRLGVTKLLLTNAAGSVDRRVGPGAIVLGDDALSLFFRPLARPARDRVGGPRNDRTDRERTAWSGRTSLVDPALAALAEETALQIGVPIERGTLVGAPGPCYETAAEIRAWRRIGGTVASMSTVPEALEARELGMRVLLLSLVTNYGTGLARQTLTHAEVVEVADRAGARLGSLLSALVQRL